MIPYKFMCSHRRRFRGSTQRVLAIKENYSIKNAIYVGRIRLDNSDRVARFFEPILSRPNVAGAYRITFLSTSLQAIAYAF